MANLSFDHSHEARAALRAIVLAYGPEVLSNPQKMASLLKDLLPNLPTERTVLVAAAEAGVGEMLRDRFSTRMNISTAIRLTAFSLEARTALTPESCLWGVTELAIALGLSTGQNGAAPGSSGAGTQTVAAPPTVTMYGQQPAGSGQAPLGAPKSGRPGKRSRKSQDGVRSPSSRRQSDRRPPQPEQADDAVSRALRAAVRPGLLAFNPPAEMLQGRKERVEVGIARSPELRQALATGLRGRGEPQFDELDTSPFMGVELKGTAFEITPFSPLEQLVAPLARWEFDVTPYRAGHRTLTLCISLRIDLINSGLTSGARIAVPVLERDIRIRVDVAYGARRFLVANWQWLIVTAAGLGGGLAAWITLFH